MLILLLTSKVDLFKMNKILWVFVITFAFVYGDEEATSSSSSEEDIRQVAAFLEDKFNVTIVNDLWAMINKTKEQCPDIEDKFDATIEEVANCIDEVELGSDTFCSLIRKNFATCAEPARKLIAGCLPRESKELPTMAIKITLAVIDQVCNSTVEQILELFNPCIVEEKFTSHDACIKIKDAFVEHRNKLPTKDLICKMLPQLKQCAKDHQDASCKNPVTKQALIQFHEAIDRATTDDCQVINKA